MVSTAHIEMVVDRLREESYRQSALLSNVTATADKTRETQNHHSALLETLIRGQAANFTRLEAISRHRATPCTHKCHFNQSSHSSSTETKPSSFWNNFANTALIKWIVGLLALLSVLRGDDALTLLQLLLKVG